MAESYLDDLDDATEEELQYLYEEACNDEVDLQNDLRAKVLEAQKLSMRLKAVANTQGRSLKSSMPTALTAPVEDQRTADIRATIEWLAAHIILDQTHILDVGFEVPIGGRSIQLRRVMQWQLPTAPRRTMSDGTEGDMLRLTVPVEHHAEIIGLLHTAKMHGSIAGLKRLQTFAWNWDLVIGEFMTATHKQAEPSLLLAHRYSSLGMLVASWPTQEALLAHPGIQASQQQVAQPASGQERAARTVIVSSQRPYQNLVQVGQKVKTEFEGNEYVGVLQCVDKDGRASVLCDTAQFFTHVSLLRPAVTKIIQNDAADEASNRHRFLSQQDRTEAESVASQSSDPVDCTRRKRTSGHRRTQSSAL